MTISSAPSRIERIFSKQGCTLHVRRITKPRDENALVHILNNTGLHTVVNPRSLESTESLQKWVKVVLYRHITMENTLTPFLHCGFTLFWKFLIWDGTSCILVYVYHTPLGNFRFFSQKWKSYTLKIEAAYVCENLNKGFLTLYGVITQKLLESPSWKPSKVGCHIYSDISIIFQMSSQNTRRISYSKNEEACMLDTVTLSFMNWRFLYTVINFVFFAALCFSNPDWLLEVRQRDVSIYVLRILSRWAVRGPHMTHLTSHTLPPFKFLDL